ncbi:hypothetical protein GOP47_0028324 [Adiantum capillus-veneris]|nr:hypothetical protein GOP47_0028324 [Adiantum capillus-veneris]
MSPTTNIASIVWRYQMEARAHGALRAVPWESWRLWNEVGEAVFSSSPDRVSAALNKIAAWRARSSLPVAVEVTWDLISIQRADPYFSGSSCLEGSLSNELLCLMYSMAIMRLINGIVDHSKKQSSLSVADRAESAGLPRMLVDIRHEVAHQELPSLSYLRLASQEAIDWLKGHYWEAQKQVLEDTHKHLQDKLQIFASSSDASESKALSGRRSNGVGADEVLIVETKHEKLNDFEFSDDAVDAEFQKSQFALLRAKRCLQSFCKSHHPIEGIGSEGDVEASDEIVNTVSSDSYNALQKVESGHKESHSSLKAVWAVADDWKPCAIGMLPSKVHPAGVLPFPGILFPGIAKESTAGHIAEKWSNEIRGDVPEKKAVEAVASLDLVERKDCSESEKSDIMHKRLKTDTEAPNFTGNQEDLRPLDHHFHSGVSSENPKIAPNGPPPSKKCEALLSAGGFLLMEGIYQRCGINELAAIRSSIQIWK